MAAANSLVLQLDKEEALNWATNLDNSKGMTVGPMCLLIPKQFHDQLSSDTLKSYLASNNTVGQELEKLIPPADIPVIVRKYTEDVYQNVLSNLNDRGRTAVEKIHPWVLNTIIDWDDFDQHIIDKEKVKETSEVTVSSDANNNIVQTTSHWSKEATLKLIEYHTEHESLFVKIGYKKKNVWDKIAAELNQSGFNFTATQCEQKWKNLTKKYRDVIDHNGRSGSDPKTCPFFNELQDAYGYRPNCKPCALISSCNDEGSSTDTSSTAFQPSQCEQKASPKLLCKRKKAKQGSEEVVSLLREIHGDIKEDQRAMLDQLDKQHTERMKMENEKLKLMSKLIDKIQK